MGRIALQYTWYWLTLEFVFLDTAEKSSDGVHHGGGFLVVYVFQEST